MTLIQRYDDSRILKILRLYDIDIIHYRNGQFNVLIIGPFDIRLTHIEKIKKYYNCEFLGIERTGCKKCEVADNFVSLRFQLKNLDLRVIQFECGHVDNFDVSYNLSEKEWCYECSKSVQVIHKFGAETKLIDDNWKQANR
jgi:hypothetical protein